MRKRLLIAAGIGLAAIGGVAGLAQYRSIEKPAHTVVTADGDFELRQYAPMVVAEVTHSGSRERALNAGFRRLAAYIFAEDRPGEAIAMTSPVIQDPPEKIAMTAPVIQDGDDGGAWRTRFVMPSKYTLDTLPQPPEDIALEEIPGRRMVAVKFAGAPGTADLQAQEVRLREWMATQDLSASGPAEYAFYDAPMVPAPLRRNEVMIPVDAE
ncbi:SOUL family heme-binding protein [Parerythrobacter jejuensis]|uniref:Heme-binding protein n=1 Tax=Parerythrobacter jejuensis TaxID=795812 RepID=A0A845ARD3_9SPHN|nr:heme-binding protein [Parerythrobacter jejuensis]MXP32870.1 heme-binding protein [Parerythrobacter jejuensis]